MKCFNAILQELEHISPVVANIQKENVWSIPIDYFDSILPGILSAIKNDASINITNEVAEELKTISPLLASLSKASILSVPEHYFDDNVYNNQHKIISINNRKKKKYIWLAAASVALLVGLGLNKWRDNKNVQTEGIDETALTERLDKIDEQSLIAYVDNNFIANMSIYNTTTNTTWDMDINEAVKQIDANEIKEYVMANEHLVEANNE